MLAYGVNWTIIRLPLIYVKLVLYATWNCDINQRDSYVHACMYVHIMDHLFIYNFLMFSHFCSFSIRAHTHISKFLLSHFAVQDIYLYYGDLFNSSSNPFWLFQVKKSFSLTRFSILFFITRWLVWLSLQSGK